jgi:hypothetical protein
MDLPGRCGLAMTFMLIRGERSLVLRRHASSQQGLFFDL